MTLTRKNILFLRDLKHIVENGGLEAAQKPRGSVAKQPSYNVVALFWGLGYTYNVNLEPKQGDKVTIS